MNILKALDEVTQDTVNAVAFWFMRRGVRRSWLLYTVCSAWIFLALATSWIQYRTGESGLAGLVASMVVFAAFAWLDIIVRQRNEEAEEAGVDMARRVWWPFKLFIPVTAILEWQDGGSNQANILFTINGVVALVALYLVATPPSPPDKEESTAKDAAPSLTTL